MNRRLSTILLVAIVCTLLLSSCAQKQSEQTDPASAAQTEDVLAADEKTSEDSDDGTVSDRADSIDENARNAEKASGTDSASVSDTASSSGTDFSAGSAAAEDAEPEEEGNAGTPSGTDSASANTSANTSAETAELNEEDVREKAEAISAAYGLQILYGSEVPVEYTDYTAAVLEDQAKTYAALEVLDRTLSIYPPGFFSSVKEGYCDSITICLAKDLHAINDDDYIESAFAFTTVQDDTIWLVLNALEPLRPMTLIHELTHVVDYRLLGMNQMRETEWNRLNPPGFSYYNAYLDEDGTDLRISGNPRNTAFAEEDPEEIWFWDSYSKTFAMEDRARLMENLLAHRVEYPYDSDFSAAESSKGNTCHTGNPDCIKEEGSHPNAEDRREAIEKCFSSPNVQTKLRFYFYTLRQAFENIRWPDETIWEEELRKLSENPPAAR